MSNEHRDNTNLKTAIVTVASAGIAALSYYLGHIVATEKYEEENEAKSSQPGTSSSTNPHSETLEECSICLKKMKPVRNLKCGHHFHDECISQWLPLSSTCPICRAKQHPE